MSSDKPSELESTGAVVGTSLDDLFACAAPAASQNSNSLCDALDRILSAGVATEGEITISVAGVDLLYVGLKGLLCAIDAIREETASSETQSLSGAPLNPPHFDRKTLDRRNGEAYDQHRSQC